MDHLIKCLCMVIVLKRPNSPSWRYASAVIGLRLSSQNTSRVYTVAVVTNNDHRHLPKLGKCVPSVLSLQAVETTSAAAWRHCDIDCSSSHYIKIISCIVRDGEVDRDCHQQHAFVAWGLVLPRVVRAGKIEYEESTLFAASLLFVGCVVAASFR